MGNCFSTLRGKDHCLDDRAGKYEQLLQYVLRLFGAKILLRQKMVQGRLRVSQEMDANPKQNSKSQLVRRKIQ